MILFIFSFILYFVTIEGHDLIKDNIEQRISGGNVARIEDFPFAAVMLTNGGFGQFVQTCGATILTTSALLSAASCFVTPTLEPQNEAWWQARVGSNLVTQGTIHTIRRITIHEDFSATTKLHNVAVLRTTSLMVYSPGVHRAALAGQAYPLAAQVPVQGIGWGAITQGGPPSNELRMTNIFTVAQDICESRYAALSPAVTDSVICAGWLDVGIRSQCEGDEGSPLVHNGVVVGVHSFNQECGSFRYPGLNTRVSSYITWILRHATEL